MFVRYKGKTENFKYKGYDFSNGPAEVPDDEATTMIKESPGSFNKVIKAPIPAKPAQAKPAQAKPAQAKPAQAKPAPAEATKK